MFSVVKEYAKGAQPHVFINLSFACEEHLSIYRGKSEQKREIFVDISRLGTLGVDLKLCYIFEVYHSLLGVRLLSILEDQSRQIKLEITQLKFIFLQK